MFTPRSRFYKKVNKKPLRITYENKSNTLRFGSYGIQAIERGFLTTFQIEAIRRTLTSRLKRKVKIWIRAYPDFPRTSKPKEVRMGRGKGKVDRWVSIIKPGRILFEVRNQGSLTTSLKETLEFSMRKFPFFVRIVSEELNL